MIHELKTLPEFFEAVISGKKKFEVRSADRPFHVGDLLALNEYDADRKCWTGRSCLVRIDYILNDSKYCKSGYVTISFSAMTVAPYENIRGPLDERGVVPLATKGDDLEKTDINKECKSTGEEILLPKLTEKQKKEKELVIVGGGNTYHYSYGCLMAVFPG